MPAEVMAKEFEQFFLNTFDEYRRTTHQADDYCSPIEFLGHVMNVCEENGMQWPKNLLAAKKALEARPQFLLG